MQIGNQSTNQLVADKKLNQGSINEPSHMEQAKKSNKMNADLRNRLGFILLGLCNNFSFSIMLSAANDLMGAAAKSQRPEPEGLSLDGFPLDAEPEEARSLCNPISTSAVLLADIIPALLIQVLYPIFLARLPEQAKIFTAVALAAGAFLITGFSSSLTWVMLGTCSASMAYGLGETTFLSASIVYGPSAVIGWSVGTGCAGLASASSYAVMRTLMGIESTMCSMLLLPALMLATYYLVLVPVGEGAQAEQRPAEKSSREPAELTSKSDPLKASIRGLEAEKCKGQIQQHPSGRAADQSPRAKGKLELELECGRSAPPGDNGSAPSSKLRFCLVDLFPYYAPMMSVYFGAYFINQGLAELIFFKDFAATLAKADQYRWLQVAYQLGSLLSRISILFFRCRALWFMGVLQPVNVGLVLAHTLQLVQLPGFFWVVGLVFYEGCLTGANYANTYYKLRQRMPISRQALAISVVAVSNSLSVLAAALIALPTHNKLCQIEESLYLAEAPSSLLSESHHAISATRSALQSMRR